MSLTNANMLRSCALIIAVLTISGRPAQAVSLSSTVLTGGDYADGYTPLPMTVAAYNLSAGSTDQTIQGILFADWHVDSATAPGSGGTITRSGVDLGGYNSFPNLFTSGSADDTSLGSLGTSGWFTYAPASIIISGLSAGVSYQVDLFSVTNNDTRQGLFEVIGATTQDYNTALTAGNFYNLRGTVTPDGSNNITIRFTNGTNNPALNGFSVTTTIVPEPSSWIPLMFGAMVMFAVRRHPRPARVQVSL
jgi:hypothetical protein